MRASATMTNEGGSSASVDGDGRRASKVGSKLYWYGSGGEVLAETDSAGNIQNEYAYFGGRRVAMVPATGSAIYYDEDLLGSSRVMVQSNGTLCYDGDFTPFGAERSYVSTCSQNYKFEGKERDTETSNDDFGAREYSWRFGRWLSSDWSAVPVPVPYANLTNPQTLNLYSMVADDPESFADLDGHEGFWTIGKRGTQDQDGCNTALATCSDSDPKSGTTEQSPPPPAQNQSVTFSSTKTTETFNDKPLVDTLTTTTTSVTLSTQKDHEGEFLGAATETTTHTKDLTAGTTTDQTATTKLNYAQAVGAAGGASNMARLVDAVTPGLGTHFASITAQDARAHPYKYAGAAASAAISVIDPPATIGAAVRALVPAVLSLLDSTTGP